jgi:molybdopterin converting factor subunit 1
MRITIRLFGRLHDLCGATELERHAPAEATVATVWAMLAAEFPSVAPYARSVSAAVNADFAKMTTVLAEGDDVAFLPPVSGGAQAPRRTPGEECS